jgi:ribose-phosphate pyrophosphokinase
MEEALLFAGRPAEILAQEIMLCLEQMSEGLVTYRRAELIDFPNSEVGLRPLPVSVRGKRTIVLQCPCFYEERPVDVALREVTLLCDALNRASAAGITLILTCFPYQRQERKDEPRTAISAGIVARELRAAMGDVSEKRLVSLDLHAPAIQGFVNIPMDALTALPELAPHVAQEGYFTVVSPDVGGAKRAEIFVRLLEDYAERAISAEGGKKEVCMAVIYKRRQSPFSVEAPWAMGRHALRGRDVVVVDDILSTGTTARKAAKKCRELGAQRVALAVVHADSVSPPWENLLSAEAFDQIFITDTLPPSRWSKLPEEVKVVSVAPLLAQVINRIVRNESVSTLEYNREWLEILA